MTTISKPNKPRLTAMALRVKDTNVGLSVWRELALIVKCT
jgi:hypothetical protein